MAAFWCVRIVGEEHNSNLKNASKLCLKLGHNCSSYDEKYIPTSLPKTFCLSKFVGKLKNLFILHYTLNVLLTHYNVTKQANVIYTCALCMSKFYFPMVIE